ncbi:hypothetical protein ACWCQS_27150 [Streptomyces sp. NPDC002076]
MPLSAPWLVAAYSAGAATATDAAAAGMDGVPVAAGASSAATISGSGGRPPAAQAGSAPARTAAARCQLCSASSTTDAASPCSPRLTVARELTEDELANCP